MKVIISFKLLFFGILFYQTVFSQPTVGVTAENPGSQEGYVLFAPFASKTTYLIDKCGRQVNSWTSQFRPGYSCYLLDDGSLLRACDTNIVSFQGAIGGGVIEKREWNGNLSWSYIIANDSMYQDHDICPLPNGNVLAVVLHKMSSAQAIAEGRNPALTANTVWDTKLLELQPIGSDSAAIVWQWSAFDHLVQDYDNTKQNFGVVADHPELVDINYHAFGNSPDWLHINSVAYNAALDQLVLSINHFNEFWIIDHSTITQQAGLHTGGNSGKGGDLLYRWGDPQAYDRGTSSDQKIFNIHNAHWIPNGFEGEGQILLFNNGNGRTGNNTTDYSSVDSYTLPYNTDSTAYLINSGQPYLPNTAYWAYTAPNQTDFFSFILAGAQRLSNGNTLICEATEGHFFEVNENNEVVWDYISPVGSNGIASQGEQPLNNYVFRCTLYEPGYAGFANHTLTPGNRIELNPGAFNCLTTGIENSTPQTLRVFPNPFTDKLSITLPEKPSEQFTLTVFDYTGKIILKKENIFTREITIVNHELPAKGIYLFSVTASSFSHNGKFILQ